MKMTRKRMAASARGAVCAGLAMLSCAMAWGQAGAKPVLVELFTSEGCSDCPPADRLLELLDTKQPVAGVHAIVLSEHVTYWNHDGWTDPFSMEEMTQRQEQYEFRFGLQDSFTPQMVVDGATQFVGSNGPALQAALEKAATKDALTIENAHWEGGAATFAVKGATPGAHLVAVLAADATRSSVARGENAGKELHHVAVVRVMKDLGANAADGRALKLAGGSLDHKDEANGPVRLVVFLVDHKTGHVVGVAEEKLERQ
jgi:hypothetical protein